MRKPVIAAGLLLATTSSLVLAGPTSILPPGFEDPAPPAPAPAPAPRPAPAPPPSGGGGSSSSPAAPTASGASSAPSSSTSGSGASGAGSITLPPNFKLPSLEELENMTQDELDEFFGLKPKFDVPPTARRSLGRVGVLSPTEGGFAAGALARQPGGLVRAALKGNKGQLVSRWGHIMLRRTLASRLAAPDGMRPVEFAALRARLLNNMGEYATARALVQDVDTANYNRTLVNAALGAYLGAGDIVGACPVVRLKGDLREDNSWKIIQHVCAAYDGQERDAMRQLDRMLNRNAVPDIDVLLAQRYGGAAGDGRRAVNIEWDEVEELTPWRHAFSMALGIEPPQSLLSDAGSRYHLREAVSPAVPFLRRIEASDTALSRGVLSSAAGVDLYSILYEMDVPADKYVVASRSLRSAYVASAPAERLESMQSIWRVGDGADDYGSLVLTAYAAARFPVDEEYVDDAPKLIASMLSAGLDRNAMRWASVVGQGSEAWGLLALAQPNRNQPVSNSAVSTYLGDDESEEQRKSKFLVAGLAGLGRISSADLTEFSEELSLGLGRRSPWSDKIDSAASAGNPVLVAMLAGLGMQGSGWDKMTPRHLYKIVKSLNDVGLDAEARMIAAEAVARG